MIELAGKTAFITGGASGLGLSMAHAFGDAGMQVMLADIEEAPGIVNLGEIEDILPGKSGELTLDLERGKYVIICNLVTFVDGMAEHHYPLGMYTGFTVE